MSCIEGVNLNGLLKYYKIKQRSSEITALSPGDFVILRGGYLGLVVMPNGALTQSLGYLGVRLSSDKSYFLVHVSNDDNLGLALRKDEEFDIIYVIPRSEWPSLYDHKTVESARAHLNKFSQNPDMQTLIASKLSYATVARHYKDKKSPEDLEHIGKRRNPTSIEAIEYKTPDEALSAIRKRAGQYTFKPHVVPDPEPEPVLPDWPKGGSIERGKQDGFVRTVTTYHIEGEMQFGDNIVTVKANGGDVQVTSNGGFMNADDLAVMIAELEKVREAIDGG